MAALLALFGAIAAGTAPALVAWARGIPTGIYRERSSSQNRSS